MAQEKSTENSQRSVTIKKGSWLKNAELYEFDDGTIAWGPFEYPDLRPRDGDLSYQITERKRPEQIAEELYGIPELWWIIAVANDIVMPVTGFYPGRVLRIPDPSYILDQVNGSEAIE